MKNLTLVAACLVVGTAAQACPVKAGKISNGAMAMPSGLKAECGHMYQVYAANAKDGGEGVVKWVELYKTTAGRNKLTARQLESFYRGQGFTLQSRENKDDTEQIFYLNRKTRKLVGFQLMDVDGDEYLGIAGN